jgi:hypothetical protein
LEYSAIGWGERAGRRILGFVTERNMTVPLRVVSHDATPDLSTGGA